MAQAGKKQNKKERGARATAWTMVGKPHPDEDEDRIETFGSLSEARKKFGENYQGFVFSLTKEQCAALLKGKVVAFDIGGREYAGFLVVE